MTTHSRELNAGGNLFDKYGSRNPVVRQLMSGFLRAFDDCVSRSEAQDVHEVGCGEGELCRRLGRVCRNVRGSDIDASIIDEARRRGSDGIQFRVADLYRMSPAIDASELIVCCEVLEHVHDPERAIERLTELARPYLLVSVPREPIWRVLNCARLRYLPSCGNTPGHINHWSRRAILDVLRRHAEVVLVRSPMPWTMALCRVRE